MDPSRDNIAMPQALAGQSSPSFDGKLIFPSPLFTDKIVVEIVSRNLEDYVELPYGTPFPANSPQASLFPNHRLTLQVEQNEEWVVRYYAADRDNQAAYNASISYSGESNAHPIFTRDFIVRRSQYAVLTKLAPLTGITSATVTAGGSGYSQDTVGVSFSGGTGSGGAITAVVSNGAVVGLTITNPGNYTVAPTIAITGGTGATGAVTLQAQVAILVKEDALAKTGDERIDSLYVLVRRVYETLPGPILSGQAWDRRLGIREPFTKQVTTAAGAGVGTDGKQIEPISSVKSEVTTWDDAAIQAQLDVFLQSTPTIVRNLRLPDVLVKLTATFNISEGAGSSDTAPAGESSGTSYSLSLNDTSHSQGSAAILPDLIIERKSWEPNNLPGMNHVVFVPDGSLASEIYTHLGALLGRTVTSIVSGTATTATAHKLSVNQIFQWDSIVGASGTGTSTNTNYFVKTTPTATTFTYAATSGGTALTGSATSAVSKVPINAMPIWYPKAVTITATGQHASVSADASAQQHLSHDSSNDTLTYSVGSGTSEEVGATNRSWQIPPTLHAELDIVDTDDAPIDNTITATAQADAEAGWVDGGNWPARTSGAVAASKNVTSIFDPLSIPATTPTDWPTSGLYAVELVPEAYGSSRTHVLVQVVDFALVNPP